MLFPVINHINDLLPHIANNPEINVNVHENGATVVCYSINGPDTFSSPFLRECRGITFDQDGKITARSLHKFFNVGEKADTQVDAIDWSQVARVMDKRDGSMITSMVINNQVVCKTKKSFTTSQAKKAEAYIAANPAYEQFARFMHLAGLTPTFEWTGSADRIVLLYPTEELVLTQLRNNVTGEYELDLAKWVNGMKILTVAEFALDEFDISALLEKVKTQTHVEGYIVQFKNGDMVKLKTPWYLELHRTVTFTRTRDVARMVIDETVDDFKAYLSSIGESLDKVIEIERRVCFAIATIKNCVDGFYENNMCADRRGFVESAKTQLYFPLIMDKYSGKEPKYKEYFLKHHIAEYDLDCL